MDMPLEIAFHNMDSSENLETQIRERADKLHRYFPRINSCHVAVEVPHKSQSAKSSYHARLDVRVPGKELVVSHDPGDRDAKFDAYRTVRDAFDAMERQLEQHSQVIRGDVKSHDAPLQGRVLRLFAEHGFIATNDGREIYFHRNSVLGDRFDDLQREAAVELSVAEGESPMGPQATTVRPIGAMELQGDPLAAN